MEKRRLRIGVVTLAGVVSVGLAGTAFALRELAPTQRQSRAGVVADGGPAVPRATAGATPDAQSSAPVGPPSHLSIPVLGVNADVEAVGVDGQGDVHLDPPMFAYTSGPDTPDFARALGKDANYVYSGSQWSPQLKYKSVYSFSAAEFVSTYQKMYGTADLPAYQVASASAAGLALQRAFEQADSLAPDKVRDALASLDITTFFGRIKFDQQGQNIFKTVVVEQIQDGKLTTVWPSALAASTPQYPTPAWATRTTIPAPVQPGPKAPVVGHPPVKR